MEELMIRLAQPSFPPAAAKRIAEILQSGQLVQGEMVLELEKRICSALEMRHTVAVANGTTALEIALRAAGLGRGDRVGVPAYSFVASANAVLQIGAEPVFFDVLANDLTLDCNRVSEALEQGTLDAVLPVDEFGFPSNIDSLRKSWPQTIIVEDAACAFGTRATPRIGSQSSLTCFSLHPRKVLTSGEGGLICTDSDDLAQISRLLRNHGVVRTRGEIDCVLPGTNSRMTEIQAVLALSQLDALPTGLARRRRIASYYSENLNFEGLRLQSPTSDTLPNWQTFLIRFRGSEERNLAAETLMGAGIESSVGAQCIPALTWYRNRSNAPDPAINFPNAFDAWSTGLAIPLHENMTDLDVECVVETLKKCV